MQFYISYYSTCTLNHFDLNQILDLEHLDVVS